MTTKTQSSSSISEKLLTIRSAAEQLGLKTWQLRRAAKRGDIPVYRPFNSRGLVRLSEVIEFIESTRKGGDR